MQAADIVAAIQAGIPEAVISIDGEGCNFSVRVVSPSFAGFSPVKRQQRVLATLSTWLESGALHAVSLKTLTPEEAEVSPAGAPASGLVSLSTR